MTPDEPGRAGEGVVAAVDSLTLSRSKRQATDDIRCARQHIERVGSTWHPDSKISLLTQAVEDLLAAVEKMSEPTS